MNPGDTGTRSIVRCVLLQMRLRHVTAPDIAHLLGRDVRTVRHQLRGETPWQVDDLVVIARRLDIPFDKILGK